MKTITYVERSDNIIKLTMLGDSNEYLFDLDDYNQFQAWKTVMLLTGSFTSTLLIAYAGKSFLLIGPTRHRRPACLWNQTVFGNTSLDDTTGCFS